MRRDLPIGSSPRRGIALVSTLALLLLLALLAATFADRTSVETLAGRSQLAHLQSDLLAQSAMEHALGLLRQDVIEQPAWDDLTEPWSTSFRPTTDGDNTSLAGLTEAYADQAGDDARWIYVRNRDGRLIGRYAVLIEDECGKININEARSLSHIMQHQGVAPFEIILADGAGAGLPVSPVFGKNLLRYRYGRDLNPGQATVDDNLTASSYASDLIDNDSDGIIDEPDEGIDEPQEYDPLAPVWDDRAFSSLREAATVALRSGRMSDSAYRVFRKFATVYSRSSDTYWDDRAQTWRNQVNANVASKRQISSILRRANEESRFEPNARNMRILVGNLTDYRDENHVLTTVGSEYGVEAVCFNEVMANDGSYTISGNWAWDERDLDFPQRFGYWYDKPDLEEDVKDPNYGFRIVSVSTPGGPRDVLTNGISVRMPSTCRVRISDDPIRITNQSTYNDFKRLRRNLGGWLPGLWRNAWLMVYKESPSNRKHIYVPYPIIDNTDDELIVGYDDSSEATYGFLQSIFQGTTNVFNSVRINNLWRDCRGGLVSVFPEVSEHFCFPVNVREEYRVPDDMYYTVYLSENNLDGNMIEGEDANLNETYVIHGWEKRLRGDQTPWKGFNPMLDVDGIPSSYSETEQLELRASDLAGSTLVLPGDKDRAWLLRTPYKNGTPVRAQNGYVHVTVSTCRDTGYGIGRRRNPLEAYKNKNCVRGAQLIRPDIVELTNISDHPISLRNWRVVINTGSYADQVGLIRSAVHYSAIRRGRYDDPNPLIEPNGYFYLTNKRAIFDREFGAPPNGTWGSASGEGYPCFELPDALWGVRYRVTEVDNSGSDGAKLKCEGANWKRDQMEYELSEWILRQPRADQNSSMGVRITITGNTRDALVYEGTFAKSIKSGDDVMILGMPREGGFLSMTLKNEYDQVAARTVTYGSTEAGEVNYSTEKFDPTHYTWRKSSRPTIGGDERRARNHTLPGGQYIEPHVKDSDFVSVGEIQLVRKAEDWQNIGLERRGRPSTKVLKALARYFTVSGIRLDPEEQGAHISGWRPAFGIAEHSSAGTLRAGDVQWEPNIWINQTLRVMSGAQKGERFGIDASTERGVRVVGYSSPSQEELKIQAGDAFSVGPGYATPMFYTRQNGDEGIWEWQHKGLEKARYGLYVFGLNDSINTTEFLEENHNAELEVSVYNYDTREYDTLPLPGERATGSGVDPYQFVSGVNRHQYEKSDGVYCGRILPEHISPQGGIRLRLVAHALNDRDCSGFAWFDYACLTPGSANGKINVNTASERVLRALNGVSEELAANLYRGVAQSGEGSARPYRNVSDILDVRDMTPDVFTRMCNLVTTRSDQFRIHVLAQAIQDVSGDGTYDPKAGDEIIAQTRREVVVDRRELTDDDLSHGRFKVAIR